MAIFLKPGESIFPLRPPLKSWYESTTPVLLTEKNSLKELKGCPRFAMSFAYQGQPF